MDMAAVLVMRPGPFKQTFVSQTRRGAIWNLALIGLAVSKKKKFANVESEWPWTKVAESPWPLILI